VEEAREAIVREHNLKLEELRVEAEGRRSALKKGIDVLGQREMDAREARDSAQAKLSSLQQQIADAESLVKKAAEEDKRRRTMRHMRSSMLEDLMNRTNRALGTICEERIEQPHENYDASYLSFFTQVVTRIEDRAARTRLLVEERSRELLGRVFSRVFSNLFSLDPHFDFNTLITPVPKVTQEVVAHWVDHNVDELVKEFAPDEDAPLVDAEEGDASGVDDDDANEDESS
jgi:hypothetical protein